MKILIVGTSFDASYGGPAVSVAGLAEAMRSFGVDVAVWAPDGSAVKLQDLVDQRIVLLDGRLSSAVERFGCPDILHDNGIWLPHNHLARSLSNSWNIPRIVSPRGMLDPWAFAHKKFKKSIAWLAYQERDIRSANLIHVTSATELESVHDLNLGPPIKCIANGMNIGPIPFRENRPSEKYALFLGRLHPVKGIDLLLSAWANVRPKGWKLVVAGPAENGYEKFLLQEAARLSILDEIEFRGPVAGVAKEKILVDADLFIAPSRSESFGMAIAEALSMGLPVLTTTAAPWSEIMVRDCGWQVPVNANSLAIALQVATCTSRERLAAMGAAGYRLIREKMDWRMLAPAYLSMYERTVEGF